MNGAESLVRTLVAGGSDVCFSNPGTSEMHFVAALDRVDGMECVLCLFEGVATGAADGWARMTGRAGLTLLHLGPGLGNGIANLHNARRAGSPIVNVVGEHATWHLTADAPLTSDIEGIARPVSAWVKTGRNARTVAADGAEAIAAALQPPGQVATLILPADTAWEDGIAPAAVPAVPKRRTVSEGAVRAAAGALRKGARTTVYLGGVAVRENALALAGKAAAHTGARLLGATSLARTERGAGRVALPRLPYPVDQGLRALADTETLVLVGARNPVAFFGYPGKPSRFRPDSAALVTLAEPDEDVVDALERLVEALGAQNTATPVAPLQRPALPTGRLTPDGCAAVIAALLPENAIVTDESVTTARGFGPAMATAAPHDWLQLTGGAIGLGLPLALGAAVACPDRKVVALEADGSGMYTLQALWSMARARADVCAVIWSNRSYAILRGELANVGAANPGRKALDMLSLEDPALDWVQLARGMGVDGRRVETAEDFAAVFRDAVAERGPFLIEVVL